jgi:hypothetical protein
LAQPHGVPPTVERAASLTRLLGTTSLKRIQKVAHPCANVPPARVTQSIRASRAGRELRHGWRVKVVRPERDLDQHRRAV